MGNPGKSGCGPAPLAIRDAIRLGCRLMKGLVLAHGAGVLHKNIKPTNVVINADGDLRVRR